MPSRVIREGWLESDRIDQLDAAAERFFLRLCLRADDFGRYHANPILLKSNLFPLKEDVRSTDIPRWIAACEKAGLLRCYEVDSKRFLEIPRFGQRTRADASKFPQPPDNDGHLTGISPPSVGHPRTESKSESKSDIAPPPAPRPRNLLIDALAEIDGVPLAQITDEVARRLGKCLKEIRAATPEVSAEEIRRRAANYPRHFEDVPITAHALAKWWGRCDSAPNGKGGQRGQQSLDIYTAPPDWRARAQAKWPGAEIPETWDDLSSTLRNDLLATTR